MTSTNGMASDKIRAEIVRSAHTRVITDHQVLDGISRARNGGVIGSAWADQLIKVIHESLPNLDDVGPLPIPVQPKAPGSPIRYRSNPASTVGMYRRRGVLYKVQEAVYGSGHLYASELRRNQSPDGMWSYEWFEYVPGAVRYLSESERLIGEELKDVCREFGAVTGECAFCGRVLNHPDSIERGLGPVCWEHANGSDKDRAEELAAQAIEDL